MKKYILMIFAFGITILDLNAQTDVSTYNAEKPSEGITYFLPLTMLKVNVTYEEEIYTPGECCRYAERYLRLSGLSDKPETRYSITGITVQTSGVPDVLNAYTIRLNSNSTAPNVQLTKDGIISAINTVKAVSPHRTEILTTNSMIINPRDFMTEEMLMASSTAKTAELAAQEIFIIRESRNAITRGEADFIPSDGESIKYILEKLDRQEEAMMQLFKGTTTKKIHTVTINVTPTRSERQLMIFRMSSKLGVLSTDNLAGAPVYMDLEDMHIFTGTTVSDNNKTFKGNDKGIRYRIPGRAGVRIFDDRGNTYYDEELNIAQFGRVETLSTSLFTKKANYRILFDTDTGAITTIDND
ncbi:MAG: DUF4831 family protein [Bacteroidaceae bacterium]|nr:DUF4831 family protein [Bacteroidaceae bacterium]